MGAGPLPEGPAPFSPESGTSYIPSRNLACPRCLCISFRGVGHAQAQVLELHSQGPPGDAQAGFQAAKTNVSSRPFSCPRWKMHRLSFS